MADVTIPASLKGTAANAVTRNAAIEGKITGLQCAMLELDFDESLVPVDTYLALIPASLNKYGIIGLAVGFIIGGAAGTLVSALVGDILMPIVTFFIPGGAWREAVLTLGPIQLSLGHFVGALIDFLIIALVIFALMKQLKKTGLK